MIVPDNGRGDSKCKTSMKNQIEFCAAFAALIETNGLDSERIKQAIDGSLEEHLKVMGESQLRETKVQHKKDAPDMLKVKGTDRASFKGILNTPLRAYHINQHLLALENDGCSVPLTEWPISIAAWVSKFPAKVEKLVNA